MTAPAPLTPADADLRDFAFMPLDVVRLRDSDTASAVTGDEFRATVMLWCASWHQVPPASLPTDDSTLAKLAGYGFAIREWKKVKAGALLNWVLCSDGRLYHPVVAEKANEAWRGKNEWAYKKLLDRTRKENEKREARAMPLILVPSFDQWLSDGRPDRYTPQTVEIPPRDPQESAGDSGGNSSGKNGSSEGIPPESGLIGKGRGKGTGTGDRDRENLNNISEQSGGGTSAPNGGQTPPPHLAIANLLKTLEGERGIEGARFTAGDKRIGKWVAAGVSEAQIRAAHAVAVQRRVDAGDASAINTGLLDLILADMINDPGSIVVPQAQKPWHESVAGVTAKAKELGMAPYHPDQYGTYQHFTQCVRNKAEEAAQQ